MDDIWRAGNIAVNVCSSLIATGMCTLGGWAGYKYNEILQLHKFRKTFGKHVRNATDIVVSVPLWRARPLPNREPRFLKTGAHHQDEKLYGPDEMFNRQDMLAAAHILDVVGRRFPKEVQYTNDSKNLDWSRSTILTIGSPIANLHAELILKMIKSRDAQTPNGQGDSAMFTDLPVFRDIVENGETGARSFIYDPASRKEYRSSQGVDYGLVLRLPNIFAAPKRFFIFFIAGIHACSTREAAAMFRKEWENLARRGNRPSGFLFKMKFEMPGTGRILRKF
jgi:hypothetical protein